MFEAVKSDAQSTPNRCTLCGKVTKRKDYEEAGSVCKTKACRSSFELLLVESKMMAPVQRHLVCTASSGNMQWEEVNLPFCCSVASESYWCS